MSEGTRRAFRSESEEARRRAAGLLIQLVREASGRTQRAVGDLLFVSADQVGNYERGLIPTREGRPLYLRIIAAYALTGSLANRFLRLLNEPGLTQEEVAGLASETAPEAVEALFPDWHESISDRDLQELVLTLRALQMAADKQRVILKPVATLVEAVGPLLAEALQDRRLSRPARSVDSEPIEGLLAEIADDRAKDLQRRVARYIESGAHGPEGEELAIELRDLIRIAPRRWRSELKYWHGRLQDFSQSYLESSEELAEAVAELTVTQDEIASLRTLADATYAAGLAFMNVGDREAFTKAQVYLRRAEMLYQDLDLLLPNYSRQTAVNRLNTVLQRARSLTWGYRRGMGERFQEAEEIYRSLLAESRNQELLEADPFLHATIWKERADNMRVSTEPSGEPHIPPLARDYFLRALNFYQVAELTTGAAAQERRIECLLNRGYIYRLLGNSAESGREMGRAHHLARKAGLVRQMGHTLLHMAESEWRTARSRVIAAYVGTAIAQSIGAKRNEEVCRGIFQRLSVELGNETFRLVERARKVEAYSKFLAV